MNLAFLLEGGTAGSTSIWPTIIMLVLVVVFFYFFMGIFVGNVVR